MARIASLLALLCALSAVVDAALDPRWVLMWNDEFIGPNVDTTKWSVRNQILQNKFNPMENLTSEAVTIQNGKLVISTYKSPSNANYMNTGYVDSAGKAYWTYGRYETYAKMPSGHGMWPAHWMLSESRCWPYGHEYDIVELPVNVPWEQPRPYVHGTIHLGSKCGENLSNGSWVITDPNFFNVYHTFAIEWFPESVTWFLDGVQYHQITYPQRGIPADPTPHFFILQTDLGNKWGVIDSTTTWPQQHIIDYVRVYAWEPCVRGCGAHGACNPVTKLCMCDSNYAGTYCEYSYAEPATFTFFNVTTPEQLGGQAAINSKNGILVLPVTAACNTIGCNYTQSSWQSKEGYGSGNYSFSVMANNVSGYGMLLTGIGGDMAYQGFQIMLSGALPKRIAFQVFGPSYFRYVDLPFDHSTGFHQYMVSYDIGGSFSLYIDNKMYLSGVPAPTMHLQPKMLFQTSGYYGKLGPYTGPKHAFANKMTFVPKPGMKAVVPTLAPTIKPATPSPTIKAATSAPSPSPTVKAATSAPSPSPTIKAATAAPTVKAATPAPTANPTTKP